MKTLIATAGLTIMFLSAGAFAGSNDKAATIVAPQNTNITVIEKNAAWPKPAAAKLDPCSVNRCIDV
jgi:hypothetical protein